MNLLDSEMIPRYLRADFGSPMSTFHGRRHISSLAKLGVSNFFPKFDFSGKNDDSTDFHENDVRIIDR